MSATRQQRKQLYERLVGHEVAGGQFQIEKLIGFGGMGAVYKAIQRNMNREVALKLIPTHDPTIAARFEREAMTSSKLTHPNTIRVYNYGKTDDGFLYLSMEYLEGYTLTELINEQAPLSPQRVVHIASQICRSLGEAHRHGIIHRDVKPDNIFLIQVDDDPDFVKVLDFGIAKAIQGDEDDVALTADGRIIGTPRYMSPEQILAQPLDHKSDLYALGCIIYEMLVGGPPFEQNSTAALMMSHAQDIPPTFAERLDQGAFARIPGPLEAVVRRSIAKYPGERQGTTDTLREELEAALAGQNLSPTTGSYAVGAQPSYPTPGPSGSGQPINRHHTGPQNPVTGSHASPQTGSHAQPFGASLSGQYTGPQATPGGVSTGGFVSPQPLGTGQQAPFPTGNQMAMTGQHAVPANRTNTAMMGVVIVLLLAVLGVVAYALLNKDEGSAPTSPTESPVAKAAPAGTASGASAKDESGEDAPELPASIQVSFTSTPAGAEIVDEKGKLRGHTPRTLTLPYDSEVLSKTFTIKHKGYHDSMVDVPIKSSTSGAARVPVKLEKKGSVRTRRVTKSRRKAITKPEPTQPKPDEGLGVDVEMLQDDKKKKRDIKVDMVGN